MALNYLNLISKLWNEYETYNPFEICNQKEIPIEYKNVSKPKGGPVYLFNRPIILLSNELMESSERYFVCAHELVHVELHNGLQNYYTQNLITCAKTEREANLFALNLCERFYREENGKSPEYFSELHEMFGVNENMMEYISYNRPTI